MKTNPKTMAALAPAEQGTVQTLRAEPSIRRRLQDLGLIPGAAVTCIFTSRHKDISIYRICGAHIAVRDCDAKNVYLK